MTSISSRAREQLRELLSISEATYQTVVQKRVLKCLAFSDMYGRFETVDPAHYKTFEWIFSGGSHNGDNADGTSSSDNEVSSDSDSESITSGGLPTSQDTTSKENIDTEKRQDSEPRIGDQEDAKGGDDELKHDEGVQRTTFMNWLSTGRGIFHIYGKLGSGKSTLMKYLCDNPRTESELRKWAGMTFSTKRRIRTVEL